MAGIVVYVKILKSVFEKIVADKPLLIDHTAGVGGVAVVRQRFTGQHVVASGQLTSGTRTKLYQTAAILRQHTLFVFKENERQPQLIFEIFALLRGFGQKS